VVAGGDDAAPIKCGGSEFIKGGLFTRVVQRSGGEISRDGPDPVPCWPWADMRWFMAGRYGLVIPTPAGAREGEAIVMKAPGATGGRVSETYAWGGSRRCPVDDWVANLALLPSQRCLFYAAVLPLWEGTRYSIISPTAALEIVLRGCRFLPDRARHSRELSGR